MNKCAYAIMLTLLLLKLNLDPLLDSPSLIININVDL